MKRLTASLNRLISDARNLICVTVRHLRRRGVKPACPLLLLALAGASVALAAPGTVFTYQGRLRDTGTPVTGLYDLQFKLFDAVTDGSQVGATLTLDDVGVTNGLFSVTLDFGAGVFTGADRWLETALRPGAETGAYATLSPRRLLASVPYAVQAANATSADNATTAASLSGALPATQLTGTLDDARLSANVALLNSSPAFTGTISASSFNGQGVLPWQTVSGASQTAAPNTAYLANSASAVTLNLPVASSVGDVIRVAGAGAGGWSLNQAADQWLLMPGEPAVPGIVWTPRDAVRNWTAVASSSNGTNLVAAGANEFIYTSTDAGATWTPRMTDHPRAWRAVASSADGLKLVAAAQNDWIYASTDGGITWTARMTDAGRGWSSVASSANGLRLMAIEGAYGDHDSIYISSDGGTNWTQTYYQFVDPDTIQCGSAVMSADGNTMAALEGTDRLLLSTDGGAHWTGVWVSASRSLALSANGQKIFLGAAQICSSSDAGATWTPLSPIGNWVGLACSADGVFLAAASGGGQIYTSTNSGAIWAAHETSRNWQGMASSADGQKLVAVVYPGRIYTSEPRLGAVASLAGAQGAEAGLLYLGNNQWQITDTSGTLTVNGGVRLSDSLAKVNRSGDTMTGPLTVPSLWAGNIGIGLTNPAYVLDAGDRIGLRGGAGGTAGLWLHNTNGLQAALIGLMDEGLAGFWGNGCGWNLVMNRTNGYVGIGTAAPSTKLQVNGTVTATAFAGNGAALTGLTGVNADQLDGQHGAAFAQLAATQTFTGTNSFLARLGVGATDLTAPLTVSSEAAYSGNVFRAETLTAPGFYHLTLRAANPGTEVVTWNFDQVDNHVTNANVLVFQRGNVGLAVADPGYVLDAGDRIRLRPGAGGTAGLWLQDSNRVNAGFMGLYDDGRVGMYGKECGWSFFMNRTNGNVGIATANPSTKLQVNGTVTATAFAGNGAGLTNLSGGSIANGTVSAAQLSSDAASLAKVSGGAMASEAGGISIGTVNLPGGPFQVFGDTATVDQEQVTSDNTNPEGGVKWQSFTAGASGTLAAVELYLGSYGSVTPWSATLWIRDGEGGAGTILSIQTIQGDGNLTPRIFPLATPVSVVAGQKYTIGYTSLGVTMQWRIRMADVYAGGRSTWTTAYDFWFRTYLAASSAQPALVIQPTTLNVGIGTKNPAYTLHVNGTLAVDDLPQGDRRNVQWDPTTHQFYQSVSSRRYKENITPLVDDFQKLLSAEPKTYTMRGTPDRWDIGYIAEDIDELGLKRLVEYNKDGQPDALHYEKMVLYLVEIAKAQKARIEGLNQRLEAENAALKQEMAELKALVKQLAKQVNGGPR